MKKDWNKLSAELALNEPAPTPTEEKAPKVDLVPTKQKNISSGQMIRPNERGRAIYKDWCATNAITNGYNASSWVYVCVSKIAQSAAAAHLIVQKRDSSARDGWSNVDKHPLQEVLNNPNPTTTQQTLIEQFAQSLFLTGNSLTTKIKGLNGKTKQLYYAFPDFVDVVVGDEGIDHYTFKNGPREYKIEKENIVHMRFSDPASTFWGMSPLKAAARIVDSDAEAIDWNKVAYQNRAVTDGVFTADTVLTKPQYDMLRAQVREQHQGSKNAYTPWVLGSGMSYQQMSISPKDMDWMQGRAMNRTDICAVFGVPEPVAGIMNNATYANIKTAWQMFYQTTIANLLEDITQSLTMSIALPEYGNDIRISFDLSHVPYANAGKMHEAEIRKVSLEADKVQYDIMKTLFSMGIPISTIAEMLDVEIGDYFGKKTGYLPGGLIPTEMLADLADDLGDEDE